MKYFIDTEFIEGTQKSLFGHTKPTIDLISIGIVADDGREYYAISKDFNLKEAWNRYELNHGNGDQRNKPPIRVYWLRENVLKPIWAEHAIIGTEFTKEDIGNLVTMSYKGLKEVIKKWGKSNKQIAEEVQRFIRYNNHRNCNTGIIEGDIDKTPLEFYGYYSDYDWIVFCWLFGRMVDLPKGFPMYCHDLKQIFDDKIYQHIVDNKISITYWKELSKGLKNAPNYPKQKNEHNALSDARWNKKLFEFLNTIS